MAQETRAALVALSDGDPSGEAPGIDVVDLGDDAYTRGRPHPMIAPSLVAEELRRAAANRAVGVVVFDVVLGYGAHPDPVSILVPALAGLGRPRPDGLAVTPIAILCGSQDDPQGYRPTREALEQAGCLVFEDPVEAAAAAIAAVSGDPDDVPQGTWKLPAPDAVITIGTDWFADAIESQGGTVLHVEWRPAAGGDDELASILGRLT